MAAASNLKNMALCLTGVCLICSAVVGIAYAVTADPIKAAAEVKTTASIAAVLPPFSGTPEKMEATRDGVAYTCYRTESGCAVISPTTGFGGTLTLMVGIDSLGRIHNTTVLSHSETPGLGAKCNVEGSPFREQFRGLDPAVKTLAVRKDGGDLDAITASTITSRAYALAVSNAVAVFNQIKQQDNE